MMKHDARHESASLREFLVFVYKYRRRLLLAFLLPFFAFVLLSFYPTPRYRATSVLIVRLGSEYVYQPETGNTSNNPKPALPFSEDQIVKSEVAILGSDDLHARVIGALGMDTLFPAIAHPRGLSVFFSDDESSPEETARKHLARAVSLFDRHFDIALEKDSAVITVSFEHENPYVATQSLETLIRLYLEKRKQLYQEPRVTLAQTQLEARRAQALTAERAVADYKRRHAIYAFEEQRRTLLEQRSEAQKRTAIISDKGLVQQIAFYNRALDTLDAKEREFNALQHEAALAEDAYSLSARVLDEARAYEDLQRERIGGVRVIQMPAVPAEPRRLQWLILLGGVFMSLMSVAGVAAFTEFARRSFSTPEQIERHLGTPVLAVFPLFNR